MTAGRSRRTLCLTLAALALASGAGLHALHLMRAAVSLSPAAIAVLIDELVEDRRQRLIAAGDRSAYYRNWYALRDELAIRRLQARTAGGHVLVRVRVATAVVPPNGPAAETRYYELTPREDEAWDIAPAPWRRWYGWP